MTIEQMVEELERLVGTWSTEATHPAFPGVVVKGSVEVEWLEGKRFLILRARTDHPDFPDSISIIGDFGRDRADEALKTGSGNANLCMHYFDSRGVFRACDVAIDAAAWRIWRNAKGFSQRFTGSFTPDGDTIVGQWDLSRDDVHWDADLAIIYRRRR